MGKSIEAAKSFSTQVRGSLFAATLTDAKTPGCVSVTFDVSGPNAPTVGFPADGADVKAARIGDEIVFTFDPCALKPGSSIKIADVEPAEAPRGGIVPDPALAAMGDGKPLQTLQITNSFTVWVSVADDSSEEYGDPTPDPQTKKKPTTG